MNISLRVKNLASRHNTRDPIRIAKNLGIDIQYIPFNHAKGYFVKCMRNKYIVVNSNLDEFSQLVVIAHELGHALLHGKRKDILPYEKGVHRFHDEKLFNVNCILEQEANKFAAELLLNDSLNYDYIDLLNTNLSQSLYKQLIKLKGM